MAHDLSRDALEARRRAEQAKAATEAVQKVAEMPELVIYANQADVNVQADGTVVLMFAYVSPDGERRLADVILPVAVFAPIAGKGHAVMQAATQQLTEVSNVLSAAVAKRTAMLGDTAGPGDASRDAIARARREAAGD